MASYKDIVYSKNFNVGHYGVTAIVLYLREIFNSNKELGFTVYDDDLNKEDSYDSILISTKFDWEEKYRNKRPAIIISRGNLLTGVNGTTGQGKLFSVTENGEATTYSDLVSFPIVVECLSESDIQSEALAALVSSFLTFDLRALRSLGFQLQGSATISPPQLFEKGNVSFISSVIIQIQMQRMYTAKVLGNKVLDEIKLKLNDSMSINIK